MNAYSVRSLYLATRADTLSEAESELLHQPGIALWCSIRHAEGPLLGLLLVGMRADLDPYRSSDLRELRRLVDAAVLAFTNSTAYTALAHSEATVRRLYKRYQEVQLATASAIARELHDEIINLTLTLNINSLEQVLAQVTDPAIQRELELVLEGEHTAARFLRLVCENLYPMGLDDPMGLPLAIERQVNRIQNHWYGTCQFMSTQAACAISTNAQWHALRVAREAMINAVKHAHANTIMVVMTYPTEGEPCVRLSICDNGSTPMTIPPDQTSFGVRFMQESAEALGGTIVFLNPPNRGTEVVFSFPPQSEDRYA